MNETKATVALAELAVAATELATLCEREKMERFAPFWRSVAESAKQLAAAHPIPAQIDELVRDVVRAFDYRPGGFMDMYVVRSDGGEQGAENAKFDALKRRAQDAAAAVRDEAGAGEVKLLRVRRYLTTLESALLEIGAPEVARDVRALLDAEDVDCVAASQLAADLSARDWPPPTSFRLLPVLRALTEELAPYVSRGHAPRSDER